MRSYTVKETKLTRNMRLLEPKDDDGVEHSETWGQLNRQFVEPYAEFIYATSCPQHYQVGPKTTKVTGWYRS